MGAIQRGRRAVPFAAFFGSWLRRRRKLDCPGRLAFALLALGLPLFLLAPATASAGPRYAAAIDPPALLAVQQAQFLAADGGAYDVFGFSVAISGDTALVGAPGNNTWQGSACIFVRSGAEWSQQATLVAADGAAYDSFGTAVALSDDTAVIGAAGNSVGGNNSQGSAYVFVRSGTEWSQQAKLVAADGESYDSFGSSVAVSGDTALIGAGADKVADKADQGSAYVFVRSGTSWSQQTQLTATDGNAGECFGCSVALCGDTALIGAVGFNNFQGSAYIFVRSGTSWSQQAKFIAPDGEPSDYFAHAVAISGDTALVGAEGDDVDPNPDQGSAYVFVRSEAAWSLQAKLLAADGAFSDIFGHAVAISGDTALVGAMGHDVAANPDQGSAYLFVRSGTEWSQQTQLTAADGEAGDSLGFSAAQSGDTALVGAPVHTVGDNSYQGSAYVFAPDTTAPTTTADGLQADGDSGWIKTSQTVGLSATDAGGSGVATTCYTLDGGDEQTYSAPFSVTGQGSHTLTYWSVDNAGNEETPHNIGYVNIDTTAPVLDVSCPQEGGLYAAGLWAVTFASSDALSGINATARTFTLDGSASTAAGVAAAGAGAHTMSLTENDLAGNSTTVTRSFTVVSPLRVSIRTPNSGTLVAGDSTAVSWSLNGAVASGGSFRVWLKDTTSGVWVRITPAALPVVSLDNQVVYSVPWTITQAAGTYKLWVYYYKADGITVGATAVSSGTITLLPKVTPTISAPNSGSFTLGDSQIVSWTLNRAAASGSFRVWLKNTATNAWVRITPAASPVAAVPGLPAYSVPWNVSQALGNYTLWVYYYSDVGGSATVSAASSSGTITILPKPTPSISTPNGGSFLRGGSTAVGWTMNRAVGSGSFRVWLKNTIGGAWVRITPAASPVAAVAGLVNYAAPWVITQPAGDYRLWVYYYSDAAGTVTVTAGGSSGTITLL